MDVNRTLNEQTSTRVRRDTVIDRVTTHVVFAFQLKKLCRIQIDERSVVIYRLSAISLFLNVSIIEM